MPMNIVRYGFEQPLNGIVEVEFTQGTLNLLQLGEHAKLQAAFQLHFRTLAGMTEHEKMTQERFDRIDADTRTFNTFWARWARIRSANRGIRVLLAGEDIGREFMDSSWSDLGWQDLEGLKTIPLDLFEALDEATIRSNPRVFNGLIIPDDLAGTNGDGDPNSARVGVLSAI
jgi:hypothetical protein